MRDRRICLTHSTFPIQSQSVETLIHEAYIRFGEAISTSKIEELRNKHRRKTVHQFEIETENIIVKQFKDNGYVELDVFVNKIWEMKSNIFCMLQVL